LRCKRRCGVEGEPAGMVTPTPGGSMSFHDHTVQSITGDQVDLSDYEGTVCLVVNVASR
ncbi:MAG: hypothetical protein ACI8S6_000602, partial [Myxococcota bacterium]